MKTKKAFTLIELLVVVLIIAILAAIALPQYNKSVEKARMVEVSSNIKAIKDSFARAQMGVYTGWLSFKDLDITLPAAGTFSGQNGEYYRLNDMLYEGGVSRTGYFLYVSNGDSYEGSLQINKNGNVESNSCWTNKTDKGRNFCKMFPQYQYIDDSM